MIVPVRKREFIHRDREEPVVLGNRGTGFERLVTPKGKTLVARSKSLPHNRNTEI